MPRPAWRARHAMLGGRGCHGRAVRRSRLHRRAPGHRPVPAAHRDGGRGRRDRPGDVLVQCRPGLGPVRDRRDGSGLPARADPADRVRERAAAAQYRLRRGRVPGRPATTTARTGRPRCGTGSTAGAGGPSRPRACSPRDASASDGTRWRCRSRTGPGAARGGSAGGSRRCQRPGRAPGRRARPAGTRRTWTPGITRCAGTGRSAG